MSLNRLGVIAILIFQSAVSAHTNLTTLTSIDQLYLGTGQRGISEVGLVQHRNSEVFAYLGRRGGPACMKMLGSEANEASDNA